MFSKMTRFLPHARRVRHVAVERGRKDTATSSLYVTGDKASETYSVLTPYIDLNERFKDYNKLKHNLDVRGIGIDLDALKVMWETLKSRERSRIDIEKRRHDIVSQISSLKDDKEMVEKVKHEGRMLRDELKGLSKCIWDLEKKSIIVGLALPNDIHAFTPLDGGEKVLFEFGSKSNIRSDSHLKIAEKLDLVDFYDSSFYFLKDDAAMFELGISYFFLDKFRENGYTQMSNSDFSRSVVVEGVGLDPTDCSSVFTLEKESDQNDPTSRLHLVGGASLPSFCAYHAKTICNASSLPLRYVTMGRHYSPGNSKGLEGLFSTWQSSAVEVFIATLNHEQAMKEFQSLLDATIDGYCNLGYHFRVEYLPAQNLLPWESLRASIQMFSQNLQQYIEVGSVSLSDDYISKRLLMCCSETERSSRQFLHIVSGTLVSVPHVLGCILEYESDKFSLPPLLQRKVRCQN